MRRLLLLSILLAAAWPAHAQDPPGQRAFEHAFYLERAKRDYEGAAASYREALAGFADQPESHLNCRIRLASCLLQLGRTEEAQEVLRPTPEDGPAPESAPAAPDTRPAWQREIEATLAGRKVTLDMSGTPLADVILFLSEVTGVPMVLDATGLAEEELRVDIRVEQLATKDALGLILALKSMEYAVRCGVVVIAQAPRLAELPALAPAPPAGLAPAWAVAQQRMVPFALGEDTELSAACAAISSAADGLRIVVMGAGATTKVRLGIAEGGPAAGRGPGTISAADLLRLTAWLANCQLQFGEDAIQLQPRLWTGHTGLSGRGKAAELARLGGGGERTELAVTRSLDWLVRHQSKDGSWEGAGYHVHCKANTCSGASKLSWVDPGLTGLATLAFLGAGHTHQAGAHQDAVARALSWIRGQVGESGRIGGERGHYLYNHTLCTLALVEAYALSSDAALLEVTRKAVRYLIEARNPGQAWRYSERAGDNDVSVSAWALQALVAARLAGIEAPGLEAACEDGRNYLLSMTSDAAPHVTGYSRRPPAGWAGPTSARFVAADLGVDTASTHQANHTPSAIAVFCQRLLGRAAIDAALCGAADVIAAMPPAWDLGKGGALNTIDCYYWYFGSNALFQMGGERWAAWNRHLVPALVDNQRGDGDELGSWDPIGAWGFAGGRVYATALNTLTLEVYYRYAQQR